MNTDVQAVSVSDPDLLLSLLEMFSLRAWAGRDGFLHQIRDVVGQLDNIRTVSDQKALHQAQGALMVLDFIENFESSHRTAMHQAAESDHG